MEQKPPSERLAAVLAAASAPPRPDELAGEQAALAAFRARTGRGDRARQRRRRSPVQAP